MEHHHRSRRVGIMTGVAAVVALIALAAGPASIAAAAGTSPVPNTIYMTDFTSNSQLFRLNPANGAKTLVGSSGLQLTDIAFRGMSLYAVSFNTLYLLNPATGHIAHVVGSLGTSDTNALVARSSTGTMYAGGNSGGFYSVNLANGHATRHGSFGPGLGSAGDLEFVNGVLYATLNRAGFGDTFLAKVNPANGHATLVGDMGFTGVWGLTLHNGVVYGATSHGIFLKVNLGTGHGTRIGVNGVADAGLANSPA